MEPEVAVGKAAAEVAKALPGPPRERRLPPPVIEVRRRLDLAGHGEP
jgi:hypothetical protein